MMMIIFVKGNVTLVPPLLSFEVLWIVLCVLRNNATKGRRQNSLSVTTNKPQRMTNVGD